MPPLNKRSTQIMKTFFKRHIVWLNKYSIEYKINQTSGEFIIHNIT